MSKEIIKDVLNKIKKEHITPKPRWQFLLKKSVFWAAFAISLVIGGIASSVTIFMVVTNDWDIHQQLGTPFIRHFFETLPYFWIVLLIIFIAIAYYNFRHTDKGYKYRFPVIVGINIVASIIVGFALFGVGAAQKIEHQTLQRLPFYQHITFDKRANRWMQPDMGLIGGRVIEIISPNEIDIENPRGERWKIMTEEVPAHEKQPIKKDMPVQIMGEMLEDALFKALHIRPWKGNFIPHRRMTLLLKENFSPLRIR